MKHYLDFSGMAVLAHRGGALVAIFITLFDSITIAFIPIIILFITGGIIMLKIKEPNETSE